MKCPLCYKELKVGTYLCSETDYRILDKNNNFEFTCVSHDLSTDDEEINDSISVFYCSCKYYLPVY
tara:strand:+ start:265 stop:462 length:198 start_codon:yes stop_codon:yes gene_type:complete